MLPNRTAQVPRRGRLLLACAGLIASACTHSNIAQPADPLNVRASADSLAADGTTTLVVSAELPASAPQDATVEFSTSVGRLIGPAGAPDRKATVRAQGGHAEVRLISPGEVGTAFITATGGGSSAQTAVELTPAPPDAIGLFVDRTTAPADGSTAITMQAVLTRARGAVSKGIPVRFEARDSVTQAVLPALSGTVAGDSEGSAKLRLVSSVPATVQIRASVGTVQSDTRTVRFTPPAAASRR